MEEQRRPVTLGAAYLSANPPRAARDCAIPRVGDAIATSWCGHSGSSLTSHDRLPTLAPALAPKSSRGRMRSTCCDDAARVGRRSSSVRSMPRVRSDMFTAKIDGLAGSKSGGAGGVSAPLRASARVPPDDSRREPVGHAAIASPIAIHVPIIAARERRRAVERRLTARMNAAGGGGRSANRARSAADSSRCSIFAASSAWFGSCIVMACSW